MELLKWTRSEDGYTDSKCGRFSIAPRFFGRCDPVDYEVMDEATGACAHMDTQREAKAWAQGLAG